jgi:hypothetical protein
VPTRAEKGGFTVPLQHVPQAPPSESESRPAWLSRSTWHWHASTYDTLVTIVSPLRWLHVESKQLEYRLRRRPASGRQKRSPGAPITKPRSGVCVDLHLSSVQWSHPWCGNPYGLRYFGGTLLVIFLRAVRKQFGRGEAARPSFSQRHQNRQLSPGRSAKRTMSRSETPADLMSNMNEGREGGVMFDCSKR